MVNNGNQVSGRFLAVGLLLLFYALALGTSLAKSPTVDEPLHLLRGVVLGQTGQLHLQYEHGPLSHRFIGLFLPTEEYIPDVRSLPSWPTSERTDIARELVWESGLDVERIFFLGRLPLIWLGLLVGAMAASWALSWLGRKAMAVTLVLFAVSPNLLASSALATTDLATSTFYFGTVYAWWRFFQYGNRRWWWLTAVLLGFALATKLTALLLIPVIFFLALIQLRKKTWTTLLIDSLLLLPAAFSVFWFAYGFEFAQLEELNFPLPAATYLRSWLNVLNHVQQGHAAFFMGELSMEGWWLYFPATFLLKTPVITIALIIIGAWMVIRNREWEIGVFLLVPVLAILLPAIVSRLNIGYRHILPAVPFLLVAAGAAVLFFQRRRLTQFLLLAGLFWILFSGVRQFPNYLAYFNEIAGGTDQGYRYLGDSNLDWGQDLAALSKMVQQSDQPWLVSYAGVGDPAYYDIAPDQLIEAGQTETFFPANPGAGMYALSANHIQGLLDDRDLLDWFRRREPDGSLGGSILVYNVIEQGTGNWVAQCLDPGPILSDSQVDQLLGQDNLRQIYFDCRDSLVLPEDGRSPGWFILPQADHWWFEDGLADEAGSNLNLVYRHHPSEFGPSYDVLYWSGELAGEPLANPHNEAETVNGETAVLPYPVNDLISLQAYNRDAWITDWLITSRTDQPLSIQAHLYFDEAAPPVVGDDLGFSSDQWQPDDRLLQLFVFPGVEDPFYLETGIYNFHSLELLGESLRLPGE